MKAVNRQSGKAMVVGLGKTGLSVARYLHARGYAVAVTDSREAPPALNELRDSLPDVALFVGGFSEAALANADLVVVSPGVPLDDPFIKGVRETHAELIGDIELFARETEVPVVAVTGSNGKSTVATLVARMAERAGRKTALGGNVGTPVLELLADEALELCVLELSSFQLESTYSLAPAAAVVLNVTPDHIDWHGSIEKYALAKARIFQNAGVCVFNRDDDWSRRMADGRSRVVSFGKGAPVMETDYGIVQHHGESWLFRGDAPLTAAADLRIHGTHNHLNALAALALGEAVGLPLDAMLSALRDFPGLPHRMAWVGEHDGVLFVNDSKGTNVGATVAAIQGADRKVVLIAGGDAKGQDFTELVDAAAGRVRHIVLIGKDASTIAKACDTRIPFTFATGMSSAVREAQALARPGDMVLLSPACSSLDMFSGYEARGDAFVQSVRELRA